jgi:hypothetical protein
MSDKRDAKSNSKRLGRVANVCLPVEVLVASVQI